CGGGSGRGVSHEPRRRRPPPPTPPRKGPARGRGADAARDRSALLGPSCARSKQSCHSGARVKRANPEARDSPMCNRTSEVWSFGPSRNDEGRIWLQIIFRFYLPFIWRPWRRHEFAASLMALLKPSWEGHPKCVILRSLQ